jgi:hypothetical protein
MDAIYSVAMRCLAMALAAALLGAAIGSDQLLVTASVTLVICAASLIIVIGIETSRELARLAVAAWSRVAKSLGPFSTAVTASIGKGSAVIAARIRRLIGAYGNR